jgi:sodium transport system permease protein
MKLVKPKFLVVLRKELTEALRDRRTLAMLALFVVMYPVLIGVILHSIIDKSTKVEREGIELAVINGAQAPTLLSQLEQHNVTIVKRADMSDAEITSLLRTRKVVGVLKLTAKFGENYHAMRPARIEFWFDSAAEQRSRQDEIERVLRDYNRSIAGARLLAHGVSPAALAPILLQRYDTATNDARAGGMMGGMVAMLFFPAFIFGLSTAIDSTAGERERRSLEVLLAQPARPLDLIGGKWLAAATLAITGLTLELVAAHFILKWLPLEEIGMSWNMDLPVLFALCAASIPLCLFAAAVEIALSMNAKSFKEAQTMAGFALMIPMLPAFAVPMLNLDTASWMYLVPVLSNQTLFQELAKGQAIGALPFVLTCASSMLAAGLAIGFATWRLKSESYVLTV